MSCTNAITITNAIYVDWHGQFVHENLFKTLCAFALVITLHSCIKRDQYQYRDQT